MDRAAVAVPAAADRNARPPLPARAQYLIGSMLLATLAAIALGLALPHRAPSGWWTFAILLTLVLAADRLELYAGRSYDVRIATLPMVAAALLLPAALVVLCGVSFAAHRLGAHLLLRQRIFNGANHALSGLAAWASVWALGGVGHPGDARVVVAGVTATVVYVLISWGLLIGILHLTRDLSFENLRHQLAALLITEAALGLLGTVVAALWHQHAVLVPLAILPLVLVWTSLKIGDLREEANLDVKTGLYNARHLRSTLEAEIDRAIRYQRALTLLVADLDFLREVNNVHGHLVGDEVIAGVADVLRRELRATDVAARFGGEEFVVVLPETPPSRGVQVAERIRRAVAEHAFDCGRGGEPVHVTVSIGLASFPADATNADELVSLADEAVYDAKSRGRNRVSVAAGQPLALQV